MNKPTDLRKAILRQAEGFQGAVTDSDSDEPTAVGDRRGRQPGRIGKASVTGYFRPEVRRQLRRLAADSDTTIQALLGEALNDLFAKHGLPEIAAPE